LDAFADSLNEILVKAYRNILRLEEASLKSISDTSLSINEMHLIECVGKGEDKGVTISNVATELCITRPSATIAVNKLEKKGYVQKINCQEDGRVVYVTLTEKGQEIDVIHEQYHKNMVNEISKELNENERKYLVEGIKKLNNYFKKSIGEKA